MRTETESGIILYNVNSDSTEYIALESYNTFHICTLNHTEYNFNMKTQIIKG